MGVLSGNVTFTRFAVKGVKPRAWGDEQLDALRKFSAGSEDARKLCADGIQIGWTAGGHLLDTAFEELKQIYPDHLLFEMRVDTHKLPADLLKAYYEIDLRALAKENPSGKPTRANKKAAKASAAERLREEAVHSHQFIIKRKCIPILWDNVEHALYVGTASVNQLDRVARLFGKTFSGAELVFLDAGALAMRAYKNADDESLSEFVPGIEPLARPAFCPADHPNFLGNEFLLWLWYVMVTDTDTINLPDQSDVTLMFSGGIKIEDPRAQTGKGTLNSASAVRLPEARTAIRHGKLPRQAALTLVRNDEQFSFIFKAEPFAITGCKLPKPPADMKETRKREEHRLQAVHDLGETVDLLYRAFLALRMGEKWDAELKSIQKWLQTREAVSA